jgi:hypothetical protein
VLRYATLAKLNHLRYVMDMGSSTCNEVGQQGRGTQLSRIKEAIVIGNHFSSKSAKPGVSVF